ncbi:hypothetical protein CCOS865_03407 [Pseudomonas reidholzensis]|uniref:Uncharacterized protein n=1 Tax=Pseudomonas reidholzensis TaxID=1785162 RepID=A0A383RXL5_9PSED|nr:hypothetical protein [Pseudomonas reidholzensis]SYX91138.1 hypothetical protein CCOS865_03407 [Pseudomonas reidholzensis]
MTEKIKINGIPPQYDESELERRVADWVKVYKQTEQSMELVSASLGHEFLQLVIDKANQGYTITQTKRLNHAQLYHSTYMVKPPAMQEEDIAKIRIEQKEKYVAHLQAEHARYQDMLRQQLIQAAEEKERKAAETAKAKQMAAIEKQVSECYTPLSIPE